MTEQALTAPLTPREEAALWERLLPLLAEQTRRYTGGESSSVPAETARLLQDSLLYCLDLSQPPEPARVRAVLSGDPWAEFQRGLARIREQMTYGQRLWETLRSSPRPVSNRALEDTLAGIGAFWKRYNPALLAKEIPCSIDYPLARPVSERLGGVDYVNRWLEHLAVELRFLSAFPPEQAISVLERSCPDWKGLLVNLFEPVAANALGKALLGLSAPSLDFTDGERAALSARLEQESPAGLRRLFRAAGEGLAERLGMSDPFSRAYLADWAEGLAVRAAAVRDLGGLSGIFL
ncbi:MAG: DUF6179 domain-containing protein [Candidatus Enterenecus sp.]